MCTLTRWRLRTHAFTQSCCRTGSLQPLHTHTHTHTDTHTQTSTPSHHLWELGGVQRLSGNFHHGLGAKSQWCEDVRLLGAKLRDQGGGLGHRGVQPPQQHPVPSHGAGQGLAGTTLGRPHSRHRGRGGVLLVLGRVRLAQHPHLGVW
ncbi:hypothetical protein F751_5570 [Auxenochlorella protothecoides]|uniref:Uncharacterized protein n=1 Tax=Auxenochlorella protothecoides TaxID=3075 RepID=A0A087SAV7_AUXPR|nr:hypothetical protein F751_5570 [Auxenochlorella protothecoides]KFM22861.1 hypothetical protein F751_5570 [Auxenochlorella protothecoides]